jgi:ribosomal protein S18 acetylase RimI-like enzyme
MGSEDNTVEMRPAATLADYLYLRKLRNEVRLSMTNNTGRICLWQQLRFYWRKPAGIDIYIATVDGARAGYLLLREQPPTALITEAVGAAFRGRGIARRMVEYAKTLRPHLTADILETNAASLRLHRSAGFVETGQDGPVKHFRFSRGGAAA